MRLGVISLDGLGVLAELLFQADDHSFTDRTAASIEFLAWVLVVLFSAHVRFIHFHFNAEQATRIVGPDLPDAMAMNQDVF